MRKIPTLFKREFENHHIVRTLNEVIPGMEWVLEGKGKATVKWDGACCLVIRGGFYKRYDAKRGKPIPEGAVLCQEKPDPITGHWPCWVKVDKNKPEDKWFVNAWNNTFENNGNAWIIDGTYEAIGKHFQGNPYHREDDILIRHGIDVVKVERMYAGIKKWLTENYVEGLVFYDEDFVPRCKIKRSDFGLEWNGKNGVKCESG